MSMTPNALREAYLSFFESKGHTRWPSDSLVPANDPTLLFTGAGMNQFKEMFMGVGNLPFVRAVTAQKCLRTGDLENVGKTHYHHTFFEMLGNFSFGDYFKKEAIAWQWEFLTEKLGIPIEKLRVSVYEDDDEAYAIWRDDVGLPEEKIWRLGAKDNFWPADAPEKGPNGPCGPCSEIFFDFGSPGDEGDPEAERYCEIGNVVFTQFNRVGKNKLEPLAQRNIDTGMGFERILAVMNGVRSNFETELFLPTIREIAKATDADYTYDMPMGQQYRRIAEHVRAAVFLIADGVKPSNEGRGYVVRRIIRRAVRDAIALGISQPIAPKLVSTVVEVMGEAYPEVVRAKDAAVAFVRAEAVKFRETYDTGIQLLENEIEKLGDGTQLSGETAFILYDSHGFPLELSEEICAERGLTVDRAGFDRCMEQQRQRSREGSDIAGDVFVASTITAIKKEVDETEFLGYGQTEAESEVVAIFQDDKVVARVSSAPEGGQAGTVQIVTRASPFYAEAGGQVGDRGGILGPGGNFRVLDTQKKEGYIVHTGTVEMGDIAKGNTVRMIVDWRRRAAITRNHTATHLLHAALRTVLGKHVTQAGSRVDPERLRFDFTHPQAVRSDELEAIEAWVNDEVFLNSEVITRVMPLDQARAAGAMALFGEKYADVVRVVSVGEHSTELCGGIHVGSSAEIGGSLLTGESGVASGVRRVEMVTGGGTLSIAREQRGTLRELSGSLKARPAELPARIESLQEELRELRRQATERKKEEGLGALEALLANATDAGGIALVAGVVDSDDAATLRSLSDAVKKQRGEAVTVLVGRGESGVALLATATNSAVEAGIRAGDLLRGVATSLGGKGGGRPQMAQGRAPSADGAEAALQKARDEALSVLSSR
ncbi:MAG: alanine--tRNA ligase [Planctomycetota bacterium]|jgi:alanyl-tRNA synthetase